MRINRFVALATGVSRRAADELIKNGHVTLNGQTAGLGTVVTEGSEVKLDEKKLALPDRTTTIVLNKPVGYVCSRAGQGSKTIYDLLPSEFQKLKPIGRLDKDSSGLLLLTNDGQLAQKLAHPSHKKEKVYDIKLGKPLRREAKLKIERGISLEDGVSHLKLYGSGQEWTVVMREGRNRQIRRTFAALNYQVINLHRINFGNYGLDDLQPGNYKEV